MYKTSPAFSIAGKCNPLFIQITKSIRKSSQVHSHTITKTGILKKHPLGSISHIYVGLAQIKSVKMISIKTLAQDSTTHLSLK